MRRPREPLPPSKPERKGFHVSTEKHLTFVKAREAFADDGGVSLDEILAKLPVKDPTKIRIVDTSKNYDVGKYAYHFHVKFEATEEYVEKEFQKAMRKYERDLPKWEAKMKEYNEKFEEWKAWKKAELEKEIGGL